MTTSDPIGALRQRLRELLASANVLFERPGPDARSTVHHDVLDAYLRSLRSMDRELADLAVKPENSRRWFETVDHAPDSIDYLNHTVELAGRRPVAALLAECLWDAVRRSLPLVEDASDGVTRLSHMLRHAARVFQSGLEAPARYVALLEELCPGGEGRVPRLVPGGLGRFAEDAFPAGLGEGAIDARALDLIQERAKAHDRFAEGRTFRPVRDELLRGPLGDIRSLDNFYGYVRERKYFQEHFAPFLEGRRVPPLLLTGIPGVGKTHLTIAFALSMPEVVLINASTEYLESRLEWLVETLAGHPYRKFLVFFDDIEPDRVDWTTFRNQVEGYLPYPSNTAIVIASNGDFSARVKSRCAHFVFRPMSPEVCQEFVAEYLEQHKWMSRPYPNLVSTVAADYASMYKRGVLNELTPRSLIRYFETLETDRERIRLLIRESLEEIVRTPSEEAFYQSNKKIAERLEQERRERLGLPPLPPEPEVTTFFGKKKLSEDV